jgi:DNA-binding transcriptional MerR regulator
MARRKYTEEQAHTAAELREEGLSIGQIARRIDMTEQSVMYHCLRLGADLPAHRRRPSPKQPSQYTRNGYKVRRFTPEEDKRLLELEATGMPTNQIAKLINRPANSTRGRLMTLAQHEARRE